MSELEEYQIDLVIAEQLAIANVDGVEALERNIKLLTSHLPLTVICQILLHSLPAFICEPSLIGCVEAIFEDNDVNDDMIVDVAALLDPNPIPESVFQLTQLSNKKKTEIVAGYMDSVQESSNKYNFDTSRESFDEIAKCLILKLNDEYNSFEVSNPLIERLKTSKFTSLDLLDWINNMYIPFSKFDNYMKSIDYTLLDYQNIVTSDELVDLIFSHKTESQIPDILEDVFLPYAKYTDGLWSAFNTWLTRFIKSSLDTSNIESSYRLILTIFGHDHFINELAKTKYFESCICLVLTMVYLTPRAELQVLIDIKQILVLMQSFNLPDGTPQELFLEMDFDNVFSKMSATKAMAHSLIKNIEVSESLYHNNLSFMDVLRLKSADKKEQMLQLEKYIDNEVTIETTNNKWKLFLSSTYFTLKKTDVFSKISDEEFSEVIFGKLLDLKRFEIIQNIFNKEFNYLTKEKYQELVEANCWSLFRNSTNNLQDCDDCLVLLPKETHAYAQLKALIHVNEKLKDWKFYLKPGMHATPYDIYQVQNPILIIRKILQLNDNAYMYLGDLYYILELLIKGMDVADQSDLYQNLKSFDDLSNLLAIKLRLICLEYTSPYEFEFSYDQAVALLGQAIKEGDKVKTMIGENWFTFFQIAKNEYDIDQVVLLNKKLEILGKLLLVTPTEFNTMVLEQWQMLNSQRQALVYDIQEVQYQQEVGKQDESLLMGLGDVQTRLQRSIKESADSSADLGKNIIGWIVGAN